MNDDARRANQRKNRNPRACPECFGHVWLPSGYLPHDPDCTRFQDAQKAALGRLSAPFPVTPEESPYAEEGEEYAPRTSFPARSYWEADVDLEGGR